MFEGVGETQLEEVIDEGPARLKGRAAGQL